MKQDFLMLAQDFVPDKHGYLGFYMSEKLDGMRCLWDGGVSRGLPCADVPYANITKHDRFKVAPKATGLWTRYGQPIYAPQEFLDALPKWVCLDGELKNGTQQETVSCCKSLEPDARWNSCKYYVFDAPSYEQVFQNRRINNAFFKKEFWALTQWCLHRGLDSKLLGAGNVPFHKAYANLKSASYGEPIVVLPQIMLPSDMIMARRLIDVHLEAITAEGGEGLILRLGTSFWKPERTHDLLKVKKLIDMEGEVVGYKWASETDLGKSLTGISTNKLKGLMGSVRLKLSRDDKYPEREFDLGVGFTEAERKMEDDRSYVPGGIVMDTYNPRFPLGSKLTFRFREFTADGLPKEARHWRIHVD